MLGKSKKSNRPKKNKSNQCNQRKMFPGKSYGLGFTTYVYFFFEFVELKESVKTVNLSWRNDASFF